MTAAQFLLTDRHGGWWQQPARTNATLLELGDRADHDLCEEDGDPTAVILGRALDARFRAMFNRRPS